jgi:hypothetical protein
MNLEKRLRALEAKLSMRSVVLHFADGSRRELHGPGDFVPRLFQGVFGADLSPAHAAQLDLIRQCVGSEEEGGGHMIELLHCLLHARADTGGSVAPLGS